MIEYHRRQHDMYRYGSNLTLSASQEIYNNGGCCNARYHALPPPPCCCDHRSFPWNGNQVGRNYKIFILLVFFSVP